MLTPNEHAFLGMIEQLKEEIKTLKDRITALEKADKEEKKEVKENSKDNRYVLEFMVKDEYSDRCGNWYEVKFVPYKNNNGKTYEFADINEAVKYVNDFRYLFTNRVYVYDKQHNKHMKLRFSSSRNYCLK